MRPLVSRPGISYWVVTDRYRRWVLQASDGHLGLEELLGPKAGISLDGVDTAKLLKALDEPGAMPKGWHIERLALPLIRALPCSVA